uniref:Uncharacterized protein n=1 Tax=Rhizophora mucronata TaxID=61149 RepID=A0A2P2QAJ9_RHIMU
MMVTTFALWFSSLCFAVPLKVPKSKFQTQN